VAKCDFFDTRALDLARTKSDEPGATVSSVLQALFELLIGGENPMAARAAEIGSRRIIPRQRPAFISYVFQDSSVNDDAEQFVSAFARDLNQDASFALGLTLALIPQPGRHLMHHQDTVYLMNTFRNDRSLVVGREILQIAGSFSYNEPFPTSLVVEVIVAAVAAMNGEATQASDIPNIMSQLSLPQ
jgi:hypothetical protein